MLLAYHWRKYSSLLLTDTTRIVTAITHLELIHLDPCHFDAIFSENQNNSEPVIMSKHHQGGVINDLSNKTNSIELISVYNCHFNHLSLLGGFQLSFNPTFHL